jgi:hypothetical protein
VYIAREGEVAEKCFEGPECIQSTERCPELSADKPVIRILLYTDSPDVITPGQDVTNLGTMIRHLYSHGPTFGKLCVNWLSRNSHETDNKLHPEMLQQYDQIWFFGVNQISGENFLHPSLRGGRESELDKNEIRALRNWMRIKPQNGFRGGGVLITGDHAARLLHHVAGDRDKSARDNSTEEKFFGLGRALGRFVPRAGLLRKWEGKPTNCKRDSFNTQTLVPGVDPDGPQLQVDELPMQLFLLKFDARGNPSSTGVPHPLFLYKPGKWIRVFPDHTHEGAVIIPDKLPQRVWPKGIYLQPRPRVIAHGVDHRNCRILNILAAYNGDCAGAGRIVSDSTWHHYLNENLEQFKPSAPEGSVADQIGQFYGNLAVWLSPRSKRREMAVLMFCWLANHLFVFEESRLEPNDCDDPESEQLLAIGRVAYSVLNHVASLCEIHELIHAIVPDQLCDQFETLYFPEQGFPLSIMPSKEIILGCIVDSFQQEMIRVEAGCESNGLDSLALITSGFEKAFKVHVNKLDQTTLEAKEFWSFPPA